MSNPVQDQAQDSPRPEDESLSTDQDAAGLTRLQRQQRIRDCCLATATGLSESNGRTVLLGGLVLAVLLTACFAQARNGAFRPPLSPLAYALSLALIILVLWLVPALWAAEAQRRSEWIRENLTGIDFKPGPDLFGLNDTLAGVRCSWLCRLHLLLLTSFGSITRSPREHGQVNVEKQIQSAVLVGQIRQYYRQCLLAGWTPLRHSDMLGDVLAVALPLLLLIATFVFTLVGENEGARGFEPSDIALMLGGGLGSLLITLRLQLAAWGFGYALAGYFETDRK